MHICNNKRLIIDFIKNPTKVEKLTLDNILPGKKKFIIKFLLKNKIKKLVLILTNVFYFFDSLLNVINLGLFNNMKIYHYNKNQIL